MAQTRLAVTLSDVRTANLFVLPGAAETGECVCVCVSFFLGCSAGVQVSGKELKTPQGLIVLLLSSLFLYYE